MTPLATTNNPSSHQYMNEQPIHSDFADDDRCPVVGCALRFGHAGDCCLEPALLSEAAARLRLQLDAMQQRLEAARCTINEQARTIADLRAAVAAPGTVLAAAPVSEAVYPPMIVKEVAP